MIYIDTASSDVYYNFGCEYYFAAEKIFKDTVFLFWRTSPTLMVGKYQNMAEEVNMPYVKAHNINLVRRMSGFRSLGNKIFILIFSSYLIKQRQIGVKK